MSAADGIAVRPPTHLEDESRRLLRAYRGAGDVSARDRLVELHLPLVRTLARRYANRGERLEDLVQVGAIGLLHAIDRFDTDRGHCLAGFAVPTIIGEIRHHLRDRSAVVRIPRGCVDSEAARAPVSLSTWSETDVRLGAAIATDARCDSSEDRLMLLQGLRRLDTRERRIMHLRYFVGLSQDEIARQVGVSQVQVSRLIRASLERLRGALAVGCPTTERRSTSRIEA